MPTASTFEDWLWPAAGVAAGLGLALALAPKSTTSSAFQQRQLKGIPAVQAYLERAGSVAQIGNGFVPFGLAVAKRESNFNNLSANTSSSEVAASCNLWKGNSRYTYSRYGKSAFCIGSGGWYGFLPATGLAPSVFNDQNPQLIFDPAASTAMFTAYIEAIVRKYFPKLPLQHRNWLSIRRSMASLGTMYDYNETGQRARGTRERLAVDLQAIGASPNLMYDHPSVGNYPGTAKVWEDLRRLRIS